MDLVVYGALLLAMSFAIGVLKSADPVVVVTILAVGVVALGAALNEVVRTFEAFHGYRPSLMTKVSMLAALGGWVATAAAASLALLTLL